MLSSCTFTFETLGTFLLKTDFLCVVVPWLSLDQDWLRGENLLPHQTVEKLTRWTVYDDDDRGRGLTVPADNGRGPWESEDPAQDMLESRLNSTQVRRERAGQMKSHWASSLALGEH